MTRSSAQGRIDADHELFKGMTKKKKVKESKKATPPPIQVGEHGRHQIKSGLLAHIRCTRFSQTANQGARIVR